MNGRQFYVYAPGNDARPFSSDDEAVARAERTKAGKRGLLLEFDESGCVGVSGGEGLSKPQRFALTGHAVSLEKLRRKGAK